MSLPDSVGILDGAVACRCYCMHQVPPPGIRIYCQRQVLVTCRDPIMYYPD